MNITTRKLINASVAAALVFLSTFILKVPIIVGYIHLGDGIILALSTVMGPYAILTAAIGSALCDILSGFAMYALPTAIIKALIAWIVLYLPLKQSKYSLIIKFIIAELLMVLLYLLTDTVLFDLAVALGALPMNFVQAGAGVIVGLILTVAFQKVKLNKYLN